MRRYRRLRTAMLLLIVQLVAESTQSSSTSTTTSSTTSTSTTTTTTTTTTPCPSLQFQDPITGTCIDACNDQFNPCNGHGNCTVTGPYQGNYTCECTEFYTGTTCADDIDECADYRNNITQAPPKCPAEDNIYCQNTIGGYICRCAGATYPNNGTCTEANYSASIVLTMGEKFNLQYINSSAPASIALEGQIDDLISAASLPNVNYIIASVRNGSTVSTLYFYSDNDESINVTFTNLLAINATQCAVPSDDCLVTTVSFGNQSNITNWAQEPCFSGFDSCPSGTTCTANATNSATQSCQTPQYKCICAKGYESSVWSNAQADSCVQKGSTFGNIQVCKLTDNCATNPCGQGVCSSTTDLDTPYFCECNDSYYFNATSRTCSKSKACENQNCNGGTCAPKDLVNFQCTCPWLYSGVDCTDDLGVVTFSLMIVFIVLFVLALLLAYLCSKKAKHLHSIYDVNPLPKTGIYSSLPRAASRYEHPAGIASR